MKYLPLLLALLIGASAYADSTTYVPIGKNAIMSVTNNGTPPFTYQWYKDGILLTGGTQPSNGIAAVSRSHAGVYTCVVTNSAGSTTSDKGTMIVVATPVFSVQPADQTVLVGASVTFSASASEAQSYQWQKNGVNIAGATGPSYSIASVATTDFGNYTVIATNVAGSATSRVAALSVSTPPVVIPPGAGTVKIIFVP